MALVWRDFIFLFLCSGIGINIVIADAAEDDAELLQREKRGFLDTVAITMPGYAADIVRKTSPDKIPGLMAELSPHTILRVTARLNETERMTVMEALNSTQIMELTRRMTPEEEAQLLNFLPGYGVVSLAETLTKDELAELLTSLPMESVVNLTLSLTQDENYAIMSRLSPDAIVAMLKNMTDVQSAVVLSRLPPDGVLNITQTLSSDQLGALMTSLPPQGVLDLVKTFPADGVTSLVGRLPATAVQTLTMSFSGPQLSQLLAHLPPPAVLSITAALTPDQLGTVMTSVSPDNLLNLTMSLPSEGVSQLLGSLSPDTLVNLTNSFSPQQLATLLQTLSPNATAHILQTLPGPAIEGLLGKLPQQLVTGLVVSLPTDALIATLGKLTPGVVMNLTSALSPDQISHLLTSLDFGQLFQLMMKLPSNVTGMLLDKVPASVIVNVTHIIPPMLVGTVFQMFPPELVANIIRKASPDDLTALLRIIPPDVNAKLLPTLDSALVEGILNTIPSDLLISLLAGLPENATVGVLGRLSNETILNVTNKLTPSQLTTLLSQLSDGVINALLMKLPVPNIVHLMTVLPRDVVGNLTSALSPQTLTHLVSMLQQNDPQSVVNLTMSLPPEAVAHILRSLPSDMVEGLIAAFPPKDMNELILNMPIDTLLGLTSVLPGSFITNLPLGTVLQIVLKIPGDKLVRLINELIPGGPLNLLNAVPKEILQGLLGDIQPAQIKLLLNAIPPEKFQGMISALLPDLLSMFGQGDIGKILGPTLHALLQSLESMDSEQFGHMLASLGPVLVQALPELEHELPRLLANMSSWSGSSGLTEALPGLLGALAESVPMSSFISLLGPLIPEIPKLLARSIGDLAASMAASTGVRDVNLETCVLDIETYLMDLSNGSQWAIDMFDAMGKPARGLQKGNTHMAGNFDQCLDVSHLVPDLKDTRKVRDIKGRYCGVELGLPPGVLPPVPGKGILPDIVVELYLCLPDSCTGRSLSQLLSSVSLPLNITIPSVNCEEGKTFIDDDAAIGATCVLAFLGFLIFVGTIVDIKRRRSNDETDDDDDDIVDDKNNFSVVQAPAHINKAYQGDKLGETDEEITVDVGNGEKRTSFVKRKANGAAPSSTAAAASYMPGEGEEDEDEEEGSAVARAFMAFSLPSNTKRILGVDDVKDSVTCLHGIRVLSIFWIIIGHTFFFMATYFENALGAAEALETILGQVVIHSTLAVDSFFVISGVLAAMLFVKQAMREDGLKARNVFVYFIHRYIRLTPAYAIAIMAFTCLLPYMSDGPNWTRDSQAYFEPCKKYWWTSLSYVNNFYNSLKDQCVPWGWYLSVDLQFHWLVAPFIIIPFAVGYKVITTLLIGGLVIMQMILTVYYQSDVNGDYLRNRDEFWWKIFEKPYTRVAPFVLGLGLGYILARLKGRLRISKPAVCVGWVFAIGVCFSSVLVKYEENHVMLDEPFHWPEAARSAHEAIYRPFFSLALCWIILMCATRHGGFINSMLSWKVFVPVSKLAFCMYLLHPTVILADMWQTRVPPYFTVGYVLLRASGYIMLSAIFAFFLSVTVETPINALERIIFRRRGSASSSTAL